MMPSRRIFAVVVALGFGAMTVLIASAASGAPAKPTFGTPVVVNHWVPGFEPDVAVDTSPQTKGTLYSTWPNGFSTTISYAARSNDDGRSFHLIEGNLVGKPTTCVGGGDSELQVSPVDGNLYFADLQGLTNFSNSTSSDQGRTWKTSCYAVPTPGVDRQWIALDTNGGTSSVGAGASDGRAYFTYDNIVQNPNGNSLVMNESLDGVNYGAGCISAGVPCPLPPAVISPSEGLPGNAVVDNTPGGAFQHTIYVAHNNAPGDSAVISYCRGPASGPKTAATVAAACTTPAGVPTAVNPLWHDVAMRPADPNVSVAAFVVAAIDTAGNLYSTWVEYPTQGNTITGTGAVKYSRSIDGGAHWSAPRQINPTELKTPVQPWIAAGDPGRVVIAYYAAPQGKEGTSFGSDALTNTGTWQLYLDQSLDSLGAAHFTHTTVSDHQVKFGNVSSQGLGGSSDRSLGDYMQVQVGTRGEAVLSYVDDTSAARNPDFSFGSGQTPSEAGGPTMIAMQTGGPSLYKKVGSLTGDNRRPYGKVTDPVGRGYPDAFLSRLGSDTNGPLALDVSGVTITQADRDHLRVTMKTGDSQLSSNLGIPFSLGGTTADWIVRWAAPSYHKSNGHGGYLGDGDIFYVGMESTQGGAPKFFTGTTDSLTTTHAKYFIYTPQTTVPGSINGDTISWTVPLSAVGTPAKGDSLFSVTAFTSTQLLASSPSVKLPNGGVLAAYTPPNLIDQAPPVNYTIGKLTPGVPGSTKPPGSTGPPLATTGAAWLIPCAGLVLLSIAFVVARRRQVGSHDATR
jgi:hypothetical protein